MRELLHPEIDTEQFTRIDVPQEDIDTKDLLSTFPVGSLTTGDLDDYQAAKEQDARRLKKLVLDPTPNLTTRQRFQAITTPDGQQLFIDRIRRTAKAFRKAQESS